MLLETLNQYYWRRLTKRGEHGDGKQRDSQHLMPHV